jgi:RNA polymerase sigma-70 factor (ECF subfamily)
VERRALRMAELAVGNRDDALDLVQDAMLGLVRHYRHKHEDEWGALFYRILQSRIRDWYRRSKVRYRLFGWLCHSAAEEDAEVDPVQLAPDPAAPDPLRLVGNASAMRQLDTALQALPLRQQQAFLLRSWEGLDVAETAFAMGCSEGSVKTHYSRALQKLREQLEDHRP